MKNIFTTSIQVPSWNSSDLKIKQILFVTQFPLKIDTNLGNATIAILLIVRSISDDISVFFGLISINIALFCFA